MRIKNWAQFQHFKDRSPPWIKLHREFLDDYDINMISSDAFKFLVQLWLIASEDRTMQGLLPSPDAISFRLRLKKDKCLSLLKEIDSFLISDCHQDDIAMSTLDRGETETEKRQSRGETESPIGPPATKKLTEEQFLESLKANQAYTHINLGVELARMDAWLSTKPGRKKTRAFVVNWLNKIDKPIGEQKKKNGIQSTNPTINAALEWGRRHGVTEITGSVWGNEPSRILEGDNDSGVSFARLDERPKQG